MKKYFLDTNVLIDFLADRKPFSQFAFKLFEHSANKWQLWTSDNSITTTFCIIEKEIGTDSAKQKLALLLKHLSIQPIGKAELITALSLPFKGFEDAAQYAAALKQGNIDAIITRNKKGFKNSQITVLSPDELFI